MKSFEEFHTLRKRQRALEKLDRHGALPKNQKTISGIEQQRKKMRRTSSNGSDDLVGHLDQKKSSLQTVGSLIELYDVQVVILTLIYLDLVSCVLSLMLMKRHPQCATIHNDSCTYSGALLILVSFSNFTLIFFAVELGVLIFGFGQKFFLHLGYLLDFAIISCCLFCEIGNSQFSKEMRLLGFLRIWRLHRYMKTTLAEENEAHRETLAKLKEEIEWRDKMQMDLDHSQQTLRLEFDSRKDLERMIKGYKDEVETLNEALNIAAYDIATTTESSEKLKNDKTSENPFNTGFVDPEGDVFF